MGRKKGFTGRTPFLIESEPRLAAFDVVIRQLHTEAGTDAGKAIDHSADQGPVTQAYEAAGVDAVE